MNTLGRFVLENHSRAKLQGRTMVPVCLRCVESDMYSMSTVNNFKIFRMVQWGRGLQASVCISLLKAMTISSYELTFHICLFDICNVIIRESKIVPAFQITKMH